MKPGSENLSAEIVRLVRQGEQMIEDGESTDALDLLYRALFLDPRNARIINDIGVALLLVGRTDEAEEVFRVAVEVDPQNQAAVENLIAVTARQRLEHEADRQDLSIVSLEDADAPDDSFEIVGDELLELLERDAREEARIESDPDRMRAEARYEMLASHIAPDSRCLVVGSVERDGIRRLRSASRTVAWSSFGALDGLRSEAEPTWDVVLFAEPLAGARCIEEVIRRGEACLGEAGSIALVLRRTTEVDRALQSAVCATNLEVTERWRQRRDGGFSKAESQTETEIEIVFLRRGGATAVPGPSRTALVLRSANEPEGRSADRRIASILRGLGFRVVVTTVRRCSDAAVAQRLAADAPDLVVTPLDALREVAGWVQVANRAGVPVLAPERCGVDRVRIELLSASADWRPRRCDLAALPLDEDQAERLRTAFLDHKRGRDPERSGIGLVLGGLGTARERLDELPEAHGRIERWWRVTSRRDGEGRHRLVAVPISGNADPSDAPDPFDLLARADIAVTDESPLGLHVVARGCPLVVTGRPSYACFGFSRSASADDLLGVVASAAQDECLGASEARNRDRFFYHLLFEATVPDTRDELRELLALRLEECALAPIRRLGSAR